MAQRECFTIEYTVKDILYRNEQTGYTILKPKNCNLDECPLALSLDEIILKGDYERIDKGDVFRSSCYLVYDKKYGYQLQVCASVMVLPSNITGIKRFLRKFVKGIGKETATKIVKTFGVETLEKIKQDYHNLLSVPGVGVRKAKNIYEQVMHYDCVEKLSLYLFSHGVSSYNDVISIYEKLSDGALDNIKANPYCLCDLISITRLPLADKIAISQGVSLSDIKRLSKAVLYYLYSSSLQTGDMYSPLWQVYKNLSPFMKKIGLQPPQITKELFNDVIDYLKEKEQIYVEDTLEEPGVYLQSLYQIELGSARVLKQLNKDRNVKQQPFSSYESFFMGYAGRHGIECDQKQIMAVKNAYEKRLSVLTGGPGTGKTQTINAILAYFCEQEPDIRIALCSPTGRAAKRMSELTGQEAFTIHKLLGISEDFEYSCCLDYDFVICDEASMIDAPLFYKLIQAVEEAGAGLLLVGDNDQLPPVGAGLPFRDVIQSECVPLVKLTTLFRQAKQSQINHNARMILRGVTQFGENGLSFLPEKQDCFFFGADDTNAIKDLILQSVRRLMVLGEKKEDIMVLSAMRKSELGVFSLNKLLQEELNPNTSHCFELLCGSYFLREGDRVMQVKNNYDLGVYNGDIGVVTRIDRENESLCVCFDSFAFENGCVKNEHKTVSYSFALAKELELAYAITVHKSQGCEYKNIIMPIHPCLLNVSRSLLYTSLTRAKSKFIYVGDAKSLIDGINKSELSSRCSLLSARIANV